MRPRRAARRWWQLAAAISPTKSTMCWPSPAFSGGAFDVRASDINDAMKLAAAEALAELVGESSHRITSSPPPLTPAWEKQWRPLWQKRPGVPA